MSEKIISIDLDDPRTGKIAEAISNKTSKAILGLLAEREMSGGDIAKELGIPLNTVGYNINKLVESGLIEKNKGFFWSSKGKKIEKYRASNRKIVISPRNMIKGILPAIIFSGIIAVGIKVSQEMKVKSVLMADRGVDLFESSQQVLKAAPTSTGSSEFIISIAQNNWLWFLAGALFSLLIFLVWNYLLNRFKASNRIEVKEGFK